MPIYMKIDYYDSLNYKNELVNEEKQRKLIDSYKEAIRTKFSIILKEERKVLPIRSLFVTQSFLEKEKYDKVIRLIEKGDINIPIPVEEFFDDGFIRCIIDGHVRARSRLDLKQGTIECVLLRSDKPYKSNLLEIARNIGFKRINEIPLMETKRSRK